MSSPSGIFLSGQLAAELALLRNILSLLSDQEFHQPLPSLRGGTVAEHAAHILQSIRRLSDGYETGIVCYEDFASRYMNTTRSSCLSDIKAMMSQSPKPDKDLEIRKCFSSKDYSAFKSSYYRELQYHTEHALHHMTLMSMGLSDIQHGKSVPSFVTMYS